MKLLLTVAILILATSVQANSLAKAFGAIDSGEYEKAIVLLSPFAQKGNVTAQYNLGIMYRDGYGTPKDCTKAKKWLLKAAEQGYVDAQYNYGQMHHDGECKPYNYEVAKQWYEIAAKGNSHEAIHNLGSIYKNGSGVPQDLGKAEEYYILSDKLGNSVSSFTLGILYINEEQKYNLVKSLAWLLKSKNSGYSEAPSAIEFVKKQMNAGDIEKAINLSKKL